MGIKKDAGMILNVLHNRTIKNRNEQTNSLEIIKESGWDSNNVINALNYLKEEGLIKVGFISLDTVWRAIQITSKGINLVEQVGEFQQHFEFGVNLGVFHYNWGATER